MLTQPRRFLILGLVASVLGLIVACAREMAEAAPARAQTTAPSYLFCFWNVENLFDDREDDRERPDKDFDRWFAKNPAVLKLKLGHLSKALVELNQGRGPDILAVAEVESVRAAELLRQALNARLADQALHYEHVLMKEVAGGRHIAPAILTRLPVRAGKTRLHGHLQRILEGHIEVNGHDLVVLATHWTSQVSDKDGHGRAHYADSIYGVFRAMYRNNPKVDFLVCGDFNDTPDSPAATQHLHATGDVDAVRRSRRDEPLLLNLMAGKDPNRYGTHYHYKWLIFDQIVVSPGLLDQQGWTCAIDSVHTVNTLHRPTDKLKRPWPFGNEHEKFDRGYSDHFPVTVRLTVQGR
jgi:endonuclease/exonuclease/phosphatase family metal-dependent hydrolase